MDKEKYGDFSDDNVRRADGQGRAASEFNQGSATGERASSGYQGESQGSSGQRAGTSTGRQASGVDDIGNSQSDAASDSDVNAVEDTSKKEHE